MLINVEPKHLYYSDKCRSIYTHSLALAVYEKLFCKKRSDLMDYINTIAKEGTTIPSVRSSITEMDIIFDLEFNDPWQIQEAIGVTPAPNDEREFFYCTIKVEEKLENIVIDDYTGVWSEPYQVELKGGHLSFKQQI